MFNLSYYNLSALLLVFTPYSSQSKRDSLAELLELLPRGGNEKTWNAVLTQRAIQIEWVLH